MTPLPPSESAIISQFVELEEAVQTLDVVLCGYVSWML